MRIPESIRQRIERWARNKINAGNPDIIIGENGDDYLHRWYVIPRNRFFNIYLHYFLRSDTVGIVNNEQGPVKITYDCETCAGAGWQRDKKAEK